MQTTIQAYERIAKLAGAIVLETPKRKHAASHSAYVPWTLIRELEEALVLAGYDMKAARDRKDKRVGSDHVNQPSAS